jgi:hypothetical protein
MDYWPTVTILEVGKKENGHGTSLVVKVEDSESGAIIDAGVSPYSSYLFDPIEKALVSGEELVVHIQTKETNGKEYTNLTAIKGFRKPSGDEAPGSGPAKPAGSGAAPAAPAPKDPPPATPPAGGGPQTRANPSPAPAVAKCVWSMAEPDLRAWALRSAVDLFTSKADGGKPLPALLADCEAFIMRREGPLVPAPAEVQK